MAKWQTRLVRVLVVVVALALLTLVVRGAAAAPVLRPQAPLAHAGRWLVDTTGRVVMLHGVNDVEKQTPYYPAAAGFGADDVAFLVSEGFNALRLGIDMRGLMPAPGEVDQGYVDHLAATVAQCAAAGIFVLLDFHQDGYTPRYNGNGFPDWMAIDDGLPNPPDAVFPLYYVQNPAMQRAFEHFWQNTAIPDGLGLQDYYVQALQAIATRFGAEPMVLGTELMNEPWPGADWQPCIGADGCAALEAARLTPFYQKGATALAALAPAQITFVEPFVLFNFGLAPTTIPGPDPRLALSVHSYALDPNAERNVVRFAVAAAERDGTPLLLTEFGATTDPAVLARLVGEFDDGLVPWLFWAYNGEVVRDQQPPLGPETIVSQAALDVLVRPYPVATTGVPTRIAFDPSTKVFQLAYTTARAGGGTFPRRLDTVVYVPRRHYPNGYEVKATGARVTSKPCATLLRLRTRRAGQPVSVTLTPGAPDERARRQCARA